jgi:formylglycine-generating enzyme required for sulfatase activity
MPGGQTDFGAIDPMLEAGELPTRVMVVETFQMEITEVTARQYALCLQARVCEQTPDQRDYLDELDSVEKPMVLVSAVQADTYCRWLGRRLPTEFEWERAARGLRPSQAWPWGDEPPSRVTANLVSPGFVDTKLEPVSSFPNGATSRPGEEGVQDLVGNVWEWTASMRVGCPDGAETCPWNGNEDVGLVVRGGSWADQLERITLFTILSPKSADRITGFRCVASRT